MPNKVERALARAADKKGYTGKRKNKFIYAIMNKMGYLDNKNKK